MADAQTVINPKVRYYAWVYLHNTTKPLKGVMLEANDSTIKFINKSLLVNKISVVPFSSQTIHITTIEKIKVRKRNGVSNGTLIGSLAGALTGATYLSGDDTCEPGMWYIFTLTAEEKAQAGFILSQIRRGRGALVGKAKSSIVIDGKQSLYNENRDRLKQYSLISQ